jgi:hypothetical protein
VVGIFGVTLETKWRVKGREDAFDPVQHNVVFHADSPKKSAQPSAIPAPMNMVHSIRFDGMVRLPSSGTTRALPLA